MLCNVLNEAEGLARMWESVKEHIPAESVLVCVDGKYPDFPGNDDFSTDSTKDFAEANGHYLPVSDYECEKRTAGLRHIDTLACEGDFVLYLDADETITKFIAWPQRVGYISFTRKKRIEATYGRCRLYRWEKGLAFRNRHYELVDACGSLVAALENAPDYQDFALGDHYEKPRTKAKQDYYKILSEREAVNA